MKKFLALGAFGLLSAAALTAWTHVDRAAPALPGGVAMAQDSAAEVDISGIVEMVQGPEDARVTVREYSSFTCPHCAQFHDETYPQLKRDYIDTGKIRFVYRDVYFDKFGLWASMLARCEGPDRFFGISDLLFDKQRDWLSGKSEGDIANNLRKLGVVAGMSPERVETCLNDKDKAKALVAWYQQNAEADRIEATPTLIINDEQYSNMSYDDLKAILDEKLGG